MKNKIINYIQILKKEDIKVFSTKQNINISNKDIDTIYYYIKNKYQEFFINPNKILKELELKLNKDIYLKILELYNKYRIFI